MSDNRPKRVLILTASVGAGHNQAAKAVVAAMGAACPDVLVETIDSLTLVPRTFRAYYSGGYTLAVTKFPSLYGVGFWCNDRPQRPGRGLVERFRLWNERQSLRRLARRLIDDPPDLIVNTHFLAAPLVARLVAQGRLNVPQMVVVTDIRVHRFWHSEGVERWFVPADESAATLRRWGIAPGSITVSGIPVHPKWTAPLDRAAVLRDWSLPADRPVVLLSGGTEFVCGPVVRIARRIAEACPRAFLVVLAGRNKKLLGRLSALPRAGRDILPVAFTDRVHELVDAAALMVTKAGGLSTAECIARGTPMVLLPPVPGQEAGNAEFFARHGAAVLARRNRHVPDLVASVLGAPAELERMSAAARALYRPGARTVAEAVRDRLLPA